MRTRFAHDFLPVNVQVRSEQAPKAPTPAPVIAASVKQSQQDEDEEEDWGNAGSSL
jgi:hypothetical protein